MCHMPRTSHLLRAFEVIRPLPRKTWTVNTIYKTWKEQIRTTSSFVVMHAYPVSLFLVTDTHTRILLGYNIDSLIYRGTTSPG